MTPTEFRIALLMAAIMYPEVGVADWATYRRRRRRHHHAHSLEHRSAEACPACYRVEQRKIRLEQAGGIEMSADPLTLSFLYGPQDGLEIEEQQAPPFWYFDNVIGGSVQGRTGYKDPLKLFPPRMVQRAIYENREGIVEGRALYHYMDTRELPFLE